MTVTAWPIAVWAAIALGSTLIGYATGSRFWRDLGAIQAGALVAFLAVAGLILVVGL
ncbi:hypothetical protein IU454_08090 [Nocardia farcinica]|uniref:hypothetical protein n=1 Tax=Nocardia farcinica TaxID=37329 RepID=UPI001892DB53|nr:hypothetical protein [Nocardia farcinica]MBF6291823.1 hypothetical protein [Nocardia farcinica]